MPGCISRTECLSAKAGRRQTKTLAEVVLRSRLAERKEGAAVSGKEATTMTVRAMGALLGLKKTESYMYRIQLNTLLALRFSLEECS